MKERFLTLKEVAKLLRVSERSVFRYIHAGRLKATKVGYWRIKEKDFTAFIKKFSNVRNQK
jgi:excisionase family DNA binding protein